MRNKILVTGASGFIGSNLLARLEEESFAHIIGIDNFGCDDKWKNVSKRKYIDYVFIDDMFKFIEDNLSEISALVHLGAISSTMESDVDAIMKTNYKLTIDLYKICSANGIQFIYASSAATYGSGDNGFDDFDDFQFLSSLIPLNPYGWSKKIVDVFISKDGGFSQKDAQVVGLKFFNVYGPNEYHKGSQRSVVNSFFNQLWSNGVMNLFESNNANLNNGEQSRDFVYVSDCVDVIVWFLNHPNVSGIFNIGSGNSTTFNHVARSIANTLRKECNINYIPMPQKLSSQYQNFSCANISKLRKVGYQREMTNIDAGISEYINKYLISQDNFK